MSAITINQKNSKRFAKRLQKFLSTEFKHPVPLRQSQEYLAEILSGKNWHEFNILLEQEKTISFSPYKNDHLYEQFTSGSGEMSQVMRKYSEKFITTFLNIAHYMHELVPASNIQFNLGEHGYWLDFIDGDTIIFSYELNEKEQGAQIVDYLDKDLNLKMKLNIFHQTYFSEDLAFSKLVIDKFTTLMQSLKLVSAQQLLNSHSLVHMSASLVDFLGDASINLSKKEEILQKSEKLYLVITQDEADTQAMPFAVFNSNWAYFDFSGSEIQYGLKWHQSPEKAVDFIQSIINEEAHDNHLEDFMIMELLVPREDIISAAGQSDYDWKTIFIQYLHPENLAPDTNPYLSQKALKNKI